MWCACVRRLLLLVNFVRKMKSTNEAVSRPTVVIIGAGIAGLAAAYFLSKQEQWKIIVLEAENRVGGRVHTTPCGKYNIC